MKNKLIQAREFLSKKETIKDFFGFIEALTLTTALAMVAFKLPFSGLFSPAIYLLTFISFFYVNHMMIMGLTSFILIFSNNKKLSPIKKMLLNAFFTVFFVYTIITLLLLMSGLISVTFK